MVISKQKLQSLVKELHSSYDDDKQELILFVSFDIVNSSKYKTSNYHNWFMVLDVIFKRIRTEVLMRIDKTEPWRSIGDEIVFILRITCREEVEHAIQTTFKILNDISKLIKSGDIYQNTTIEQSEIDILRQQSILSLKASAWIAVVSNTPKRNVLNVMYMSQTEDGFPCFEFQGNDIDTGFRVSKNTRDRRLTLCFELAYLMSENSKENSNLYIISYQRLKGIWDNRLYPVIWYHDSDVAMSTLENSFYYDEDEEDELIKDYFRRKDGKSIRDKIDGNIFFELDKIAKDRNMQYKLSKIKECFLNTRTCTEKIIDSNFSQEIHCVAVCLDRENKRVLMFKRSKTLNNFPGKWEFGCSVVKKNITFEDNLEKDYKMYFNIDIKVLRPFKTYNFTDEKKGQVLGVRFIAEILNAENIKCNEKYSEYRYIDLNNIDEIDKEEYIDYEDFKLIINEVLTNG